MIKNWIITGDTHGGMATISRVGNIHRNMENCVPEYTGIIILGDAGLNFYLNNTDKKHKKTLNGMGYHIYCVRGNHEERPENLGYELDYDPDVKGLVYLDPDFENIHYLVDGEEYWFARELMEVLEYSLWQNFHKTFSTKKIFGKNGSVIFPNFLCL